MGYKICFAFPPGFVYIPSVNQSKQEHAMSQSLHKALKTLQRDEDLAKLAMA
jgi:hypothetical protein